MATIIRKPLIVFAALAFAAAYARVIGMLFRAWTTSPVYSYGLVVVLIGLYVLWTNLRKLHETPIEPDCLIGVPVTVAGIGMLTIGRLALMTSLQEASLVVTVAGLVLLFRGRKVFAGLSFPLGYLLLGIPVWDHIIDWLQPPSQILSAGIATRLLGLIGIPVLLDGTRIGLPNVTLEVLQACSGVNQLLAITAMALPAAYLRLDRWTLRVTVVVFAIATAYLSNGARIALVGFLAYHGLSNGDLRGVHLFEGLAVSAVGYVVIFGFLAFLSSRTRPKNESVDRCATSDPIADSTTGGQRRIQVATLCVLLLAGPFQLLFQSPEIRLKNDLRTLPIQIGEWTSDTRHSISAHNDSGAGDSAAESVSTRVADVDDELERTYRNASGERIRLYIGYHRAQREGKDLSTAGRGALSGVSTPLSVQSEFGPIELGEMLRDSPTGPRTTLYWYDVDGRVASNIYVARQRMVWNALTRQRTNGAVVIIESEGHGEGGNASRKTTESFAKALLPLLSDFISS